jgi:hypothetical protein
VRPNHRELQQTELPDKGELDAIEKEVSHLSKLKDQLVKDVVAQKIREGALITKGAGLEDQLAKMAIQRNQLVQAEERTSLERDQVLETVKLSKADLTNAQKECDVMKDKYKGLVKIVQFVITKETDLTTKVSALEVKLANMTKEKDAVVMTAESAKASVTAYKTAEYDLTTKLLSKDSTTDMKMRFLEEKTKKLQMENAELKKEVKLYKEHGGVMVLDE